MILYTFVLYGVWLLLSRKKAEGGCLYGRAVLNTHINGFVSFPQINLICNYSAIISSLFCFCEQENVVFFHLIFLVMICLISQPWLLHYVCDKNMFQTLWRTNSSDTMKNKYPHSLPQRAFNKILRKLTKIFSNFIADSIYILTHFINYWHFLLMDKIVTTWKFRILRWVDYYSYHDIE